MTKKEVFYYFHHDLSKKDMGGIEPIYRGKNLLFLLWWTFNHTDYDNYVDIEYGVDNQVDEEVKETKEFKEFYESELQLYRIKNELKKYNIQFAYTTDRELERFCREEGLEMPEVHREKMLIGITPMDEETYVKGYLKFIEDISSPTRRHAIYHRLIKTSKTLLPTEQMNFYKRMAKNDLK